MSDTTLREASSVGLASSGGWPNVPGTFENGYDPAFVIEELPVPPALSRLVRGGDFLNVYAMGECKVIVGREPAGINGERLLHLTISTPDRHPTWDEIKTARYRLLPTDRCFGMLLPPPEQYVNVAAQDHVFHLWEITDPREPWSAG